VHQPVGHRSEIQWDEFKIAETTLCRGGCFQSRKVGDAHFWLRCPSISADSIYPLSPTVSRLLNVINAIYGYDFNIVKIQKYPTGSATIAQHADKIIDLVDGVPIAILRLGDTRTVSFKHKETGEVQPVEMPHNTLMLIDWQTNQRWTHGVAPEPDRGVSYSLVFRKSETLRFPDGTLCGPLGCLTPAQQDATKNKFICLMSAENKSTTFVKSNYNVLYDSL
jgi:hypothetical protein